MEKTMLDYRRFKEINDLFASGQPEKARRLLMAAVAQENIVQRL